ncbi:MAG TPA: flippase activity-associated protein Agl23, partial [Anaerolineales bacterium]|nr:flippase activity-associated protein Agl23 [Anaerolineales bacterium]
MDYIPEEQEENWLDKPITSKIKLNGETLILGIILLIAIFSRLYILGARVMSHDEINHVYFAYQFYQGGAYVHNPITHGPFQFHLLEWSYFLFNDSDFSARLPAAFFSIITVALLFNFRRYLGKSGAITAALLFVISPFMLYYGRYARNESIAIFLTIATLWATLRYLDTGENKYIYISAALTALHYT